MTDRLTDRELSGILSDRVEPLLGHGDFAGAVVAAAEGLGAAALANGSGAGSPGGGFGLLLAPILFAILVVVGGLWLWNAFSVRHRGMGLEAWTRLTDTDPRSALAKAQSAHDLSEEAYELTRQDIDRIGVYGGFSRGGVYPIPCPRPRGGGWGSGESFGGSVGGRW
jgi:hypothetical protein